jgi:transposase
MVRTKGDVTPDNQGGNERPRIIEIHADDILGLVADKDEMTLNEMVEALAERSIHISRVAIWRFFKRQFG